MVRLSDLNDVEAEHMRVRASEMQPVPPAAWITPKTTEGLYGSDCFYPAYTGEETPLLKSAL